jgi:transcriptional regulator with XRE-family HTH domain
MGAGRKHPLRSVLAANLRRERAARSLSQEALADLAGLHRTFVGAVERCETNISLDNIERLATALGAEPWQLLHPAPGR